MRRVNMSGHTEIDPNGNTKDNRPSVTEVTPDREAVMLVMRTIRAAGSVARTASFVDSAKSMSFPIPA